MEKLYVKILPGVGKNGEKEKYDVLELKSDESVAIVGPTGSGKTAFINDIEIIAQGDTTTKRFVDFYNEKGDKLDCLENPCVMITQNTKCFSDVKVEQFLEIHIKARGDLRSNLVDKCIELANCFTGEAIKKNMDVTVLSGGQTRALLIADAILIGQAPLIILDEVENAGIYKAKVIDEVKKSGKMIIFVTHDPTIALSVDKRIVMREGQICQILDRTTIEESYYSDLLFLDTWIGKVREEIRNGNQLENSYNDFKNEISILG